MAAHSTGSVQVKKYTTEFGGKPLSVEIGKLAQQANGSCVVQYGETSVLITATMSAHPKPADYFPLTVDYEERYFAAGKIKGSKWIKRETRPTDDAILTARLIDRALRPRFDQNIRNEVQVVSMVLSFDGINDPDIPSLFGSSLALMISDIPFSGPVAGIRVGRVDSKLVFNPTYEERTKSDFDIVVASTVDKINMIEAGANIVPEKEIVEAVSKGFKEIQHLIEFQNKIAKEVSPTKADLATHKVDETLAKLVSTFVRPKLEKVLYTPHKREYVEGLGRTKEELIGFLVKEFENHPDLQLKLKQADLIFEEEINNIVHHNILTAEKRPDGRKIDELRKIVTEVAVLPHSHGSGLFNRGTTQALSILTLAAPGFEQWIETMEKELHKKRFMHHYQFPPFSVGEVGRMGLGRREIGHGALAERALEPIIPSKEEFPYTVRVVSEILSSNGSSSMASVCGSILAMMDGGVPIKEPAAGIAMGLMFDDTGDKFKILTDIQGPEDHHGDMDLKVAGTRNGITAMQMDVKVDGIDANVLEKSLEQAKKARLEILDVMTKTIGKHRDELSSFAPRVSTIKINPEKIRTVIGPQGKMINEIIDKTGVDIDIEQDGTVFITSTNPESMAEAIKWIESLTYEPKIGDEMTGKVVKIMDFGAFVELSPGTDGMVHVSEMSKEHVRRPDDVVKLGQSVKVRVKNIDEYGRINLTMKL